MADEVYTLFVTHSHHPSMHAETRFLSSLTVGTVKDKLYGKTGTPPENQSLELRAVAADGSETVIPLTDDSAPLSNYSPNLMTLHVTDTNSDIAAGELEDLSQVEKVTISDNAYSSRKQELADMMRKKRSAAKAEAPAVLDDTYMEAEAALVFVGARCTTKSGGAHGVVRFVGLIPELKPGHWVFVELDEPVGRNDGSVSGVRFFTCPPNHGTVLRPNGIVVEAGGASAAASAGASAAGADDEL